MLLRFTIVITKKKKKLLEQNVFLLTNRFGIPTLYIKQSVLYFIATKIETLFVKIVLLQIKKFYIMKILTSINKTKSVKISGRLNFTTKHITRSRKCRQ